MKNSACAKILCVSFLILPSLFLPLLFPKWIGFVLGAILCVSSETLATVSSLSYWILHCSPLTMIGWHLYFGGFFWHLVVLHSCWAYLLSTWGRSLVRAFTGSACEACFAAMKISIRTCMSWYFIMFFAFGIELSNFHQNLVRALHCHDNWGFTSLSTLMIYRLLVVFLYLFLNILCGYLVVYVSLSLD